MVIKKTRKINATVVKRTLTWSHFKFRERLKHKAREYPDCTKDPRATSARSAG
jgi:hypothetical protein